MSLCDKIGLYPDIVSYQCSCEFEHRVCESCYIYYVEEARNKSEKLRISKILNLERPSNSALIIKKYDAEAAKDHYYHNDPNLKDLF